MSSDISVSLVMSDEDTRHLRTACGAGDLHTVTLFLESWKARNFDMGLCNWALVEAVQQESEKVAVLLIDYGVPFTPFLAVTAGVRKMFGVLLAAIQRGWDINTPYSEGEPPALRYVLMDYEVTKWFLDHGASPNERGRFDDTPLSFAVSEASIPTIQLLFDGGGDIQKGQLFDYATWRKTADRLDVLQLLWARGLTQSAINKVKYQDIPQDYQLNKYSEIGTPLHNAARVGDVDAVKWLLEHGANPLVKDPRGRIPLQLARDREKTEIIEYLTPLSVVDDKAALPENFTDLPKNMVESKEEGREALIHYYTKHDPIPKNRRPKFDLQLKILDLNNVPLVSGTCYVKWHLPSSTSAEHRGHTSKALIRDHKVAWDYVKTIPVRLTVDRSGMLQESEIHFEVLQEYLPGARAERIVLGIIKLNLSEYVDGGDDGEDAITRRYLMQESKINSTLKICIQMKQTEGERNFVAPPLKSAPVFGGIAGIMRAESTDADDGSAMPSMSSKAQEIGKLQDLYRRNLAASWAAQAGEMPADKCIEDIFAGGDGWGEQGYQASLDPRRRRDSSEDSEGDRRTLRAHHQRHSSGTTIKKTPNSPKKNSGLVPVSGRASIEQQIHSSNNAQRRKETGHDQIDEIDAREDLRSWEIRSYA